VFALCNSAKQKTGSSGTAEDVDDLQ